MATILTLLQTQPVLSLQPGDTLTREGEPGGELYVLETGKLVVERGRVPIATIVEPGALIGEMAVLLGIDHSATVRAERASTVRVIDNAIAFLERTPIVALHVATLACDRLNATSALLVQLRQETSGKASEQSLLNRIFSALTVPEGKGGRVASHE